MIKNPNSRRKSLLPILQMKKLRLRKVEELAGDLPG